MQRDPDKMHKCESTCNTNYLCPSTNPSVSLPKRIQFKIHGDKKKVTRDRSYAIYGDTVECIQFYVLNIRSFCFVFFVRHVYNVWYGHVIWIFQFPIDKRIYAVSSFSDLSNAQLSIQRFFLPMWTKISIQKKYNIFLLHSLDDFFPIQPRHNLSDNTVRFQGSKNQFVFRCANNYEKWLLCIHITTIYIRSRRRRLLRLRFIISQSMVKISIELEINVWKEIVAHTQWIDGMRLMRIFYSRTFFFVQNKFCMRKRNVLAYGFGYQLLSNYWMCCYVNIDGGVVVILVYPISKHSESTLR